MGGVKIARASSSSYEMVASVITPATPSESASLLEQALNSLPEDATVIGGFSISENKVLEAIRVVMIVSAWIQIKLEKH